MNFKLFLMQFYLGLLTQTFAQVNQVIDEVEDLLAVESGSFTGEVHNNEVGPYEIAIEPAPPGFPGERLTSLNVKEQSQKLQMDLGNPDGKYSFSYLSKDGTSRTEEGSTDPIAGNRQSGGWEYVGPDGKTYSISFVADQNGFRPVGEHLPQPPPLPPALQRFEDAKNGFKRSQSTKVKQDDKVPEETSRSSQFRESHDRTTTPIRFDTQRLPKSGRSITFRKIL